VRLEQIVPGRTPSAELAGAILARDLALAVAGGRDSKGTRLTKGHRLPKGHRLTPEDLAAIGSAPPGPAVRVIVADAWEVHEDEAALRLASAVTRGRPELAVRGPAQSRVDLVATVAGVVDIRLAALERVNRIDPLEVFTVHDGQPVEPGEMVASVKIAPHVVPEAVLLAGEAVARRGGPLVRVREYRGVRLGVVVKGDVAAGARQRFEAAIAAKAGGLRAHLDDVRYVADDEAAVTDALAALTASGEHRADIILTAGGASTDPSDAFFTAIATLGGTLVRRGVPAHPGSMLWLAVVGGTAVVGLPSCGAYSMATAADLLLPRLAAGQPASAATVARLAHGGILTRSQRFRFPAYARDLDAPDG
jgi:molybdopterin biosynthesis enzyme